MAVNGKMYNVNMKLQNRWQIGDFKNLSVAYTHRTDENINGIILLMAASHFLFRIWKEECIVVSNQEVNIKID